MNHKDAFETEEALPGGLDDRNRVRITLPDRDLIMTNVRGVFGESAAPGIIAVVDELVDNAVRHGRRPAELLAAPEPPVAVTLAWACYMGEKHRYAAVLVDDGNRALPELGGPRTGLSRVIGLTVRCGGHRTDRGKRVWAIIDTRREHLY